DPCLSLDYEFKYDVKLSMLNNCDGSEVYDEQDELFTGDWVGINAVDYVTESNNVDGTTINITDDFTTPTLEQGEYFLSKLLRVSPEAVEYYADRYYDDIAECEGVLTLEDFLEQWGELIDTSDCQFSCQDCVDKLIAQFGPVTEIGDVDGDDDADNDDEILWHQLYEECMEPCKEKTLCEIGYNQMLYDISPGGQYGSTDNTAGTDWVVSSFNTSTMSKDWNNPGSPYLKIGRAHV